MLFMPPEVNKQIAELLADCRGMEYEFHNTLPDGRVMKYTVQLKKTEVKKKR